MDIQTQSLISEHIINDFKTFKVTTMEAIGLLEAIKLSLYTKSTEGLNNDKK